MGVPHFRIPFHVGPSGAVDVVEQDSVEEVAQCVQVLVNTRIGQRIELLDYGIPDPVFQEEQFGHSAIPLATIEKWEPRALTQVSDTINSADELLRELNIEVRTHGS
jgi:hypothetical protein